MLTSPDCPSRDFKYVEPEITTAVTETGFELTKVQSRVSMASRFSAANSSFGSRGGGSIYFDAYTGEDAEIDA